MERKKQTLAEMAEILRQANPENRPMALQWMAEQFWPGEWWLKNTVNHHNGGSRKGGRVAGAFAARMWRRGLLTRCGVRPVRYQWVKPV